MWLMKRPCLMVFSQTSHACPISALQGQAPNVLFTSQPGIFLPTLPYLCSPNTSNPSSSWAVIIAIVTPPRTSTPVWNLTSDIQPMKEVHRHRSHHKNTNNMKAQASMSPSNLLRPIEMFSNENYLEESQDRILKKNHKVGELPSIEY